MKETSEEKSLPASDKKLRDARKKGQVSSSRDLISGFGLLTMIIYLLFYWPTIRDQTIALVDLVGRLPAEPFAGAWRVALETTVSILWLTILPAVGILVLTSIVIGIVGTLGPVFSFETVKPNFEHINPVSGLKRLFSMRSVVEFAKSLVKVVLLGTVLFFVLRSWMRDLFQAPTCGEECLTPLILAALKPIIAIAALAFIIIGITDVSLQRWLFRRDMRMTKTEMKRERKEQEGDPQIRGKLRRDRQEMARLSVKVGLPQSTVVIASPDFLAGLCFDRKKAPVPVIVAKARNEHVSDLRKQAHSLGIVVIDDASLAEMLVERHGLGDPIKQNLFPAVAGILVANNLVK